MLLSHQTAFFFVYHGSRDARSRASAQRLSQCIMDTLARDAPTRDTLAREIPATEEPLATAIAPPGVASPVSKSSNTVDNAAHYFYAVGALELADAPLHEQLSRFGKQAKRLGLQTIYVVPLFLLPGAHVREDIPEEVSLSQRILGKGVHLTYCSHVGSYAGITGYLEARCTQHTRPSSHTARVFINHGSKRPRANEPVEAIAHTLNATIAYWSMPPSLETRLDELIAAGRQDIVIIPYFLFSGKITDAIAQTAQDYCHRFPHVRIHTEQPIGEDMAIASLFAEFLRFHGAHSDAALV